MRPDKPKSDNSLFKVFRQALKGSKGGRVSKRKPVATSEQSMKPWEDLGISRRTYYNHKKLDKL